MRPGLHPASEALARKVLKINEAEWEEHWLHTKQTRGEAKPREVKPALILKGAIEKDAGAFSYVTQDELRQLGNSVKVILEF